MDSTKQNIMDKLLLELVTSVNEVRTTQKSVMDRVNGLVISEQNGGECHCNHSHHSEDLKKEISGLQTKYDELSRKVTADKEDHLRLSDGVRSLQNRLESIESLLSKQAEDSKLQSVPSGSERRNTETRTQQEEKTPRTFRNKMSELENDTRSGISKQKPSELSKQEPSGESKQEPSWSSKDSGAKGGSDTSAHRTNRPNKNHGAVRKPNFLTKDNPKVEIVKQEMKLVYDGERYWRSIAQNELDINRSMFQMLEGVHSIICLDISESMSKGNAWSEAKTFLKDYLNGLEEMSKLPDLKTEHVAFITFGHETKFQMRYTNRYADILTMIDALKLGGPSQMYGGVLYALAAVWCSVNQIERLQNGAHVFTKIIMITDGKPTESDLNAGPDIADSSKIDETKAKILQELENFRKNRTDVFFVPVGTPDTGFLETMESCSDGVILTYQSGKRLARRQYLAAKLLDPLGLMTSVLTSGPEHLLSQEDKDDMRNIQQRAKRFAQDHATAKDTKMYNETYNNHLPPVGTRVRRGPDWIHNMQDSKGPGTLIGHSDEGQQVWVEWDVKHRNIYRYGILGYDVLPVDEDRVLEPGEIIAVGCGVKPGKDWKSSEGHKGSGVVIKLQKRTMKAMVRWEDTTRGEYSYGADGLKEIEVKPRFQKSTSDRNDFSASVFASNIANNSQASNFLSSSVDEARIAETIEQYAAKQKRNKNKNPS